MASRNYPSDYVALAGGGMSKALDNTTLDSDWINMGHFEYVVFDIICLDPSADTTVDAKLRSADDSSGTNAADITGLAITQFTAATTRKLARLVVRADELNGNDKYVGCRVTGGNGTVGITVGIIANGFGGDYDPAENYDSSVVQEVKKLGVS